MEINNKYDADVAIIGAGISGSAIARELSKYKVKTILVEKGGELGGGQSKRTIGNIYKGLNMVGSMVLKSVMLPDPKNVPLSKLYNPKKLLTKWSEQGFKDWIPVLKELGIRHEFMHALVVAKDKDQIEDMQKYIDLGQKVGGPYSDFEQIDREKIFELEPNVNKQVVTALYAKDHVIEIFPPQVAMALAENAAENGVEILLNAEVTDISKNGDYQTVLTKKGPIKARYVVNASGLWCDKIADMVGGRDWKLKFTKGQVIILDRRTKGLINGMVRWPNQPGRADIVQRRGDNVLIGCVHYPTAHSPEETGTIGEEVSRSLGIAKTLFPKISEKDIISTFVGVRLYNDNKDGDHIVEYSKANRRFINAVIRLPGIIGALPMSRHVVGMLADEGLELVTKEDFNPYRKPFPRVRDMSHDEKNHLIRKDPRYGNVVCLCETVTEGEMIEAIRRGAITLDGIKFRTRATMGGCQGNFCTSKASEILARELNVPLKQITKKGTDSHYIR